MALLSIFRGTQAECSARPVSDGTLLFATDTKKIYLDKDSSRIEMSSVDDLGNYVTKEQLTTALNGKANTTHTHTQDQITGLKDALAGKASTSHSHSVASGSASGFMSAADKQKLDGIATGANKYTLPVASSTALGGMKIGYKESGKNYSVKLDDNNQAYVTVPWTDTTSKDTNTTYTLTKSGSTITLEGSDGSSTAVNDDNTTYSLGSFGITATAAELNYVDGVTSNVQTQLNKKQDKMKTVTIPSSDTTHKNKWIKFATIDMSSAPAWETCAGTLSFCDVGTNCARGFLKFKIRTGGTAGVVSDNALNWTSLSSISYAASIADVKVSNGKYDIYYKPVVDYELPYVSLIDGLGTSYLTFNTGSWVDSITAATTSYVNSYADSAGSVPWSGVSSKPSTYPPSSHTHDDRYYTESEVDSKLNGKANTKHTHTITDTTGLQAALNGKADATHTHVIADTMGLQAALDSKANTTHTHTKSQITDFPSSLKNPNSLTISLNGTSQGAYDGSAAKSINVTPASIGAAASSHNHDASNITSGTLSADRIPTITDGKIQSVSASKITGTIPQSILPSYVDDVLEYENLAAFPKTGESGKIYVADDTNKTYRWSGTAYVEISASLALGTTSSTAFRGDYGNTAYAHAQAKGSAFSSGLYKITTNSQGHVTAATAVTKSDITALGIPGSDTNTNTTYSLSKSGSTITLKGSDGSTTSVTDADTNTTYSTFKGATTSAAGGTGLVPAPATGAANRYLRSDGTWQVPPDNNTTYSNMGGASSSAAGHSGLVPAPAAGASNRYLRSDGTWSVPPDNNTNTTYSLSKNGSTITLTGSDGSTTSVTDSNTTYSLSSFGVNASAAELNYVKGVTSSIQTQLNGKAASDHTHSNYLTTGGTAAAATKLATARSISIAGDGSGSASFDGTSNISIDTTILHHWATAIPAKADLNSYTDPGWYMCNSNNDVATLSNRPGNNAFAMVVLNHAGIAQIVFEYMTSGYKIYTRNKYDNVWGSWGRVYTTENKPTYSEIGAAAASHSHSNYLTTSGTAAAASKLATARTISLAGDVTGSANFDGSANISITSNIAAGTVGANELASNAVTNAKIAADSVTLAKLGSDVGTVAVQSSQPSDTNVKLWIQI